MSNNIKLPELGEMTLHMWQDCLVHYNNELTKQANHIEKLEAALREVLSWVDQYSFDAAYDDHWPAIEELARKALEGKDD